MHIKLSQEEIEQLGGRSLELSDGSGFVGSLEVYHDLHCLVCGGPMLERVRLTGLETNSALYL